MKLTEENINLFLEKYVEFVNRLQQKYQYPNNITHLLYLIVPAFILKYGWNREREILKCFDEIPIFIEDHKDKRYQAFYRSVPMRQGSEIITEKRIILNHYEEIGLLQLMDNLIHEINHAVNSVHQEISIRGDILFLRTGISKIQYQKDTLKVIKKEENSIIEEIINTKQTELIIDQINSLNEYTIQNDQIVNTLYAIKHHIDQNYQSGAYFLQSYLCKQLMNNKTFLSTLETLRYNGNIEDIDTWFHSITAIPNSFQKLSTILNQTFQLELALSNNTKWKRFKIGKIKKLNQQALEIVELFNHNCNYK